MIVGQDRIIEGLLTALLAGGHCLLEGLPGLAKTLTMETLSVVVAGTFHRIQFTPDLVPSDIVGTRIYRPGSGDFGVELGPVFANFVLADEINRAPAKVQSALLEVMSEGQVTIGGTTHRVPTPFMVLGTQNQIESEGVFVLPEAQQDRFLFKLRVGYPTATEEVEIIQRMSQRPPTPERVLSPQAVLQLQQLVRDVYLDRAVVDYIVAIVAATRQPEAHGLEDLSGWIAHGVSPRASLGLAAAGRARAVLHGRRYVKPRDVHAVAADVLRHRMVLSYEALARRVDADEIVTAVLQAVPAPTVVARA
ncbi:MoxR family ATPase [soil metagenome]